MSTCSHARSKRHLSKREFGPEEERAYRWFLDTYSTELDDVGTDLVAALEAGDIDPTTMRSVDVEVRQVTGNYTSDVTTIYREGTERGLGAGRALAARRHALDVSFDVIPETTLREFEAWSDRATGQVLETITGDVANLVRGAHEEGLGIPEIKREVETLFDNRVKGWQAERTARTATLSSSNAGNHSALVDADSVVGEQWLDTSDSRTRDSHRAAGGQVVAPTARFVVGGTSARYPGDPSLPAEEIVNCRCVPVPIFANQLSMQQLNTITAGGRIWL